MASSQKVFYDFGFPSPTKYLLYSNLQGKPVINLKAFSFLHHYYPAVLAANWFTNRDEGHGLMLVQSGGSAKVRSSKVIAVGVLDETRLDVAYQIKEQMKRDLLSEIKDSTKLWLYITGHPIPNDFGPSDIYQPVIPIGVFSRVGRCVDLEDVTSHSEPTSISTSVASTGEVITRFGIMGGTDGHFQAIIYDTVDVICQGRTGTICPGTIMVRNGRNVFPFCLNGALVHPQTFIGSSNCKDVRDVMVQIILLGISDYPELLASFTGGQQEFILFGRTSKFEQVRKLINRWMRSVQWLNCAYERFSYESTNNPFFSKANKMVRAASAKSKKLAQSNVGLTHQFTTTFAKLFDRIIHFYSPGEECSFKQVLKRFKKVTSVKLKSLYGPFRVSVIAVDDWPMMVFRGHQIKQNDQEEDSNQNEDSNPNQNDESKQNGNGSNSKKSLHIKRYDVIEDIYGGCSTVRNACPIEPPMLRTRDIRSGKIRYIVLDEIHKVICASTVCANTGCGKTKKLRRCKKCQLMKYCSRKCAKIGWKNGHKVSCASICSALKDK